MDPQEIKNRYQKLLEAYHAGQIDWNTFESGLFELKKLRAAGYAATGGAASEMDSSLFMGKEPESFRSGAGRRSTIRSATEGTSPRDPKSARSRFEAGMESGVLLNRTNSSSLDSSPAVSSPTDPLESGLLRTGGARGGGSVGNGGSGVFRGNSKNSVFIKSGVRTGPRRSERPEGSGIITGIRSDVRPPSSSDSQITRSSIWFETREKPIKGARLQAGDALCGHYILQRLLGHGQCGEAWRALEARTDNYVVVKAIPAALQNDENAWRAFRGVFRRASTLHLPNICPIYRLERDDKAGHFMVSAFLDAFSLDDYYERYCRTFREFPLSAVLRVLWPVGQALDYAHRRRVLHRDLKPQNILVGKHCGAMTTDFEIGNLVRRELLYLGFSTDAADPGPWRAPEAWLSEKYSARSDQFSLAAIAYFLLTGSAPFTGRTSSEIRDGIVHREIPILESRSAKVNATLRQAMAKKPEDRFPSCLHFLKELAGTVEAAGPHYDRREEPAATPNRFWAFLFGLPTPKTPRWLAASREGEPGGELWPFKDLETTLDPRDLQIPGDATYPYTGVPMRFTGGASSASLFGPATLLAGALAVAATVGTVAALHSGAASRAPSDAEHDNGRPASVQTVGVVSGPGGSNASASSASSGTPATRGTLSGTQGDSGSSDHSDWGAGVEAITESELPEFERRASQADLEAQRRLGLVYFYAKGLPADYRKAADYFRLAASRGDSVSLYHLARCYEIGLGIPKDPERAVRTYKQAVLRGSEEAKAALKRLEGTNTEE